MLPPRPREPPASRRMPQPGLMEPEREVPPSDPALIDRWAHLWRRFVLIKFLRNTWGVLGHFLRDIKAGNGRPLHRPAPLRRGA